MPAKNNLFVGVDFSYLDFEVHKYILRFNEKSNCLRHEFFRKSVKREITFKNMHPRWWFMCFRKIFIGSF